MNPDDPETASIISEFIVETRTNLDQFEAALLDLEADRGGDAAVSTAFRAVHSIKGSCGFLGFDRIEAVTHAGESVLAQIREDRRIATAEVITTLLQMTDVVRVLLRDVERTGHEGTLDVGEVVRALETALRATPRGVYESAADPARSDDIASPAADNKVRVDTALLEKLMNLVGELVLARNQILQHESTQRAGTLSAAVQRLNVITTEIQEVAMKTRMQPIGNVWGRFPRLVRELSRACGKPARVTMEGQETELDRSLVEAVLDPMVHLLRNAIDHGIELPSERAALGKPAEGVVRLAAFHEGGLVNVEISDDGRGLDTTAIRARAVSRGLVSAEHAERLTEREVWSLIFLPGFTTQDTVSALSGRGVGLDVVRTNIEHLGGTVEVTSRPGSGTTFHLKIPLTLAIIPALIVSDDGERFAIPQASLLEVLRLDTDKGGRHIEDVQGSPVLRLRGRLLPLTYLGAALGGARPTSTHASTVVVVLAANDRSFGLVVDDIHDTEEIVVKPLWKRLKGLGCYAGATVMGDGRVALILDALGIAQRVGVIDESSSSELRGTTTTESTTPAVETERILLCRHGRDGRLAIPLASVSRLEELSEDAVERTGDTEVVQYRGTILPLVRLDTVLVERRSRPRGPSVPESDTHTLQVVVCARPDRSVGIVVDAILDIVELTLSLQRSGSRPGITGSMVVNGRVTEFLDVDAIVRSAGADSGRVERGHP